MSCGPQHVGSGAPRRHLAGFAILVVLALPAQAQRFNWDTLGAAFCQAAAAPHTALPSGVLSPALATLIETARRHRSDLPARLFFQAYDTETTGCEVRTRNVALVEITRTWSGGSWTDYLVIVPERDGSMRVDDILFATRRSDTLRNRLNAILTDR